MPSNAEVRTTSVVSMALEHLGDSRMRARTACHGGNTTFLHQGQPGGTVGESGATAADARATRGRPGGASSRPTAGQIGGILGAAGHGSGI
jgi:hypothetical protein